jgi:hypothetical protein
LHTTQATTTAATTTMAASIEKDKCQKQSFNISNFDLEGARFVKKCDFKADRSFFSV